MRSTKAEAAEKAAIIETHGLTLEGENEKFEVYHDRINNAWLYSKKYHRWDVGHTPNEKLVESMK